uniref:Uncharacterized protein n=1 Tax=Chromera velia CCMP2878 TaxID=1169474 RepID=A0A0G4GPN6_9ALVE|eukprot:Cvel_22827.t1-p1 / transcript=Cvel_22827.t1 / gene=Cvel_22827 / organism=Chromera_velia_CCMP2878 / gene_product=hypothetical protein / transcript_product=hypothetical protein / location=Cvel_scaffold2286:11268-17296(+) / protein_length=1277 / sequence_SO=supercontig / SO=protein_coding / is_pseudo=false
MTKGDQCNAEEKDSASSNFSAEDSWERFKRELEESLEADTLLQPPNESVESGEGGKQGAHDKEERMEDEEKKELVEETPVALLGTDNMLARVTVAPLAEDSPSASSDIPVEISVVPQEKNPSSSALEATISNLQQQLKEKEQMYEEEISIAREAMEAFREKFAHLKEMFESSLERNRGEKEDLLERIASAHQSKSKLAAELGAVTSERDELIAASSKQRECTFAEKGMQTECEDKSQSMKAEQEGEESEKETLRVTIQHLEGEVEERKRAARQREEEHETELAASTQRLLAIHSKFQTVQQAYKDELAAAQTEKEDLAGKVAAAEVRAELLAAKLEQLEPILRRAAKEAEERLKREEEAASKKKEEEEKKEKEKETAMQPPLHPIPESPQECKEAEAVSSCRTADWGVPAASLSPTAEAKASADAPPHGQTPKQTAKASPHPPPNPSHIQPKAAEDRWHLSQSASGSASRSTALHSPMVSEKRNHVVEPAPGVPTQENTVPGVPNQTAPASATQAQQIEMRKSQRAGRTALNELELKRQKWQRECQLVCEAALDWQRGGARVSSEAGDTLPFPGGDDRGAPLAVGDDRGAEGLDGGIWDLPPHVHLPFGTVSGGCADKDSEVGSDGDAQVAVAAKMLRDAKRRMATMKLQLTHAQREVIVKSNEAFAFQHRLEEADKALASERERAQGLAVESKKQHKRIISLQHERNRLRRNASTGGGSARASTSPALSRSASTPQLADLDRSRDRDRGGSREDPEEAEEAALERLAGEDRQAEIRSLKADLVALKASKDTCRALCKRLAKQRAEDAQKAEKAQKQLKRERERLAEAEKRATFIERERRGLAEELEGLQTRAELERDVRVQAEVLLDQVTNRARELERQLIAVREQQMAALGQAQLTNDPHPHSQSDPQYHRGAPVSSHIYRHHPLSLFAPPQRHTPARSPNNNSITHHHIDSQTPFKAFMPGSSGTLTPPLKHSRQGSKKSYRPKTSGGGGAGSPPAPKGHFASLTANMMHMSSSSLTPPRRNLPAPQQRALSRAASCRGPLISSTPPGFGSSAPTDRHSNRLHGGGGSTTSLAQLLDAFASRPKKEKAKTGTGASRKRGEKGNGGKGKKQKGRRSPDKREQGGNLKKSSMTDPLHQNPLLAGGRGPENQHPEALIVSGPCPIGFTRTTSDGFSHPITPAERHTQAPVERENASGAVPGSGGCAEDRTGGGMIIKRTSAVGATGAASDHGGSSQPQNLTSSVPPQPQAGGRGTIWAAHQAMLPSGTRSQASSVKE